MYKKLFVTCKGFSTEFEDASIASLARWLSVTLSMDVHCRDIGKPQGKDWFHLDTHSEEQYRKIRKARFTLTYAGTQSM
jgi:hypothetical protein